MTKLKAFADDKLDVAKMTISVFDQVENTGGKEEKCWSPAFSPFPLVFSKAIFCRVFKSGDCVVKSFIFDIFPAMCEASCTWSGKIPPKNYKNPTTFSCKVFLGGVPWDITEGKIVCFVYLY